MSLMKFNDSEYSTFQFLIVLKAHKGLNQGEANLAEYIQYRLGLRDHIKLDKICCVGNTNIDGPLNEGGVK